MTDLNLNHIYRLYTLLQLKTGSRHGYEIIDRIKEQTGKEPSTSHIYPFLTKLEEEGYVKSEAGSRGKKTYSLTREGEKFVSERLESFGEMLNSAIEEDIQECSHCNCKIYQDGYEEDGSFYCCKHCAAASK